MKAALLFTGNSPLVILASYESLSAPELIEKLAGKGIDKFIACEIPLEKTRERYGGHFDMVTRDLRESDDLRILDYNGRKAFRLFHFDELGTPLLFERNSAKSVERSEPCRFQ